MNIFKSTLLLFYFLACNLIPTNAQSIPNSSFETWKYDSLSGIVSPTGWSVSSQNFGGGFDSTHNSYSGQTASKIYTWYTYLPGYIVNGTCIRCSSLDQFIKAGTPISSRPNKITGYYHFEIGDTLSTMNDSAVVIILLKKYNPSLNKIDTIGSALKMLGKNNGYQFFEIPIHYLQNFDMPDSIVIGFFSNDLVLHPQTGQRNQCNNGQQCMILKIDSLNLNYTTGILSKDLLTGSVLYPNPTNGRCTLKLDNAFSINQSLIISSFTGQVVDKQIDQGQFEINLSGLPSGLYFYKLIEKDQILKQGKILKL